MADHNDTYLDLSAAYLLGALDGDELREYESHLESECPLCASETINLSEAASYLPMVLPQLTVSPDLKERVLFNAGFAQMMSGIVEAAPKPSPDEAVSPVGKHEAEEATRHRSIPWLSYGLAFAVIVMLVGFSLYVSSLFRTIGRQNEYIATQQVQITKLVDELDRKEAILRVLGSRRIQVVTMDGLSVNPVGYGKIIWDPDKKVAILNVSNLPAVPEGRDYQLWIIRDQKPVSAGIFAITNEREKESFFQVRPLEIADRKDIDAFAVTLEPKGGVPQPTGEMYLLGKSSSQ